MLTRLVSSQFRAVAMVVLPCTVLLLGCAVAHGQFVATHGKSGDGWANWLTKAHKDGYYPVYLTGYDVGGTPQFAAIALKNDGGIAWEARHGLTSDKYQQTFDDLTAKSYRPISVSGYLDGKDLRYAAIFVKDGSKIAWEARHNLSGDDYQDAVKSLQKKGLRPSFVNACGDADGNARFAAVFVADKAQWNARHGLNSDQYQKFFDEQVDAGFRPVSLSGYETKNGTRFAVVFVKEKAEWKARHGMSADDYQKEFDKNAKADYRPLMVSGYHEGDSVRYAAVWVK